MSLISSLVKDITCEHAPGEDGNKFGEIRRAKRSGRERPDHDAIFWYTVSWNGSINTMYTGSLALFGLAGLF